MANRYWIGNSGSWSQIAHWAAASGGAGGETVPGVGDDVYFDAASFTIAAQIVTLDVNGTCLSLRWTGATNTPTLTGAAKSLTVYGPTITFIAAMVISGTITLILSGADATAKTFTIGGYSPNRAFHAVTIQGAGNFVTTIVSSYTAIRTLTIDRSAAAKTLTLTSGISVYVANFVCAVSGGTILTINATAAVAASLYKFGGTPIELDYLDIDWVNTYWSNSWYYGTHSTCNNSTGWTAGAAPANLGTAVPIAYSDLIADVGTGDGTVISGGYLYCLSRGSKNMVKIALSNMSTVIDKTYTETPGPQGDGLVMGTDGYLWTSASAAANGYICKVNPSDLSLIASYAVLTGETHSIPAMAEDVDYIYCGGWTLIVGSILFSKFDKITHAVTQVSIPVAGLAIGSHIHSLITSGNYCYGHISAAPTAYSLKILKADLTAIYVALDANKHDDIVQDDTYFYIARYTLSQIAKADLAATNITMTYLAREMDGFNIFSNGQILLNDNIYESDGTNRIHILDSSKNYLGYILITGLQDTGLLVDFFAANEVIISGWYLYLLAYNVYTATGIRVYKFLLTDFGISPDDGLYVFVDWDNTGDFAEIDDDISAEVKSFTCELGRDTDLDKTMVGVAGITVKDTTGKYVPENTGSILTGKLLPGRSVQIVRILNGVIYYLFNGFLDDVLPDPSRYAHEAYLPCVDGLDQLQRTTINLMIYQGELAEVLIGAALDRATWPAVKRDIDTGPSTFPIVHAVNISALGFIQNVAASEFGFAYVAHDGYFHYEDRNHRMLPPHLTPAWTVTETMFRDIKPTKSLKSVRNRVTIGAQPKSMAIQPGDVWTLQENWINNDSPVIPGGETRTYWGQFGDTNGLRNIAGSVVTPESTTDYEGNNAIDNTGASRTSDLTVTADIFSGAAKIDVTNTCGSRLYLTYLKIRGYIYTDLPAVNITADSTESQDKYQLRERYIDLPYYQSVVTMDGASKWRLGIEKEAISGYIIELVNSNDTIFEQMLTRRVSDRITLQDSRYAIDGDFYIDKIRHEWDVHKVHHTWWTLSKCDSQMFWVWDTSTWDFSTRFGF